MQRRRLRPGMSLPPLVTEEARKQPTIPTILAKLRAQQHLDDAMTSTTLLSHVNTRAGSGQARSGPAGTASGQGQAEHYSGYARYRELKSKIIGQPNNMERLELQELYTMYTAASHTISSVHSIIPPQSYTQGTYPAKRIKSQGRARAKVHWAPLVLPGWCLELARYLQYEVVGHPQPVQADDNTYLQLQPPCEVCTNKAEFETGNVISCVSCQRCYHRQCVLALAPAGGWACQECRSHMYSAVELRDQLGLFSAQFAPSTVPLNLVQVLGTPKAQQDLARLLATCPTATQNETQPPNFSEYDSTIGSAQRSKLHIHSQPINPHLDTAATGQFTASISFIEIPGEDVARWLTPSNEPPPVKGMGCLRLPTGACADTIPPRHMAATYVRFEAVRASQPEVAQRLQPGVL